jgi:APA family basic amino acid/polyamine antiporter
VLGSAGLTSLGIGGTIGTGIFVMAGLAAREIAGPAIMVSFLVAALACGCAALCYAELSARYPQAGSAYAYGRALVGGIGAWLIGWNLLFQYTVAAASIAQGWSHYFQDALTALLGPNMGIPTVLRGTGGSPPGSVLDGFALLVVVLITVLLLRGITLSVRVNHVIVAIKLAIVLLVIGVGIAHVNPANWQPFAPFGWGGLQLPGLDHIHAPQGMLAGAASVFYAYLGFEALTNYSEETRHPQRDIPRSILRSLAVCTLLYMAMALVLTGMVPYDQISKNAPVSEAFGQVGLPWIRTIVAVGALVGITSVLLVILLSLPRVLLAIARDGILPRGLSESIRGVPVRATVVAGGIVALLGATVPLSDLGVVAVMANMLTFIVIALLTLFLHRKADTGTGFRVPFGPLFPLLTIATCLLLMLSLPVIGWKIIGAWLFIGVCLYALRRKQA